MRVERQKRKRKRKDKNKKRISLKVLRNKQKFFKLRGLSAEADCRRKQRQKLDMRSLKFELSYEEPRA